MKTTFPDITKALTLDISNPNSVSNFVHMIGHVAMVVTSNLILFFDVEEFIQSTADDDYDEESADAFLEFIKDKKLSPGFWTHLTKGHQVSVESELSLHIVSKKETYELFHEVNSVIEPLDEKLQFVSKVSRSKTIGVYSYAHSVSMMKKLIDSIGKFAGNSGLLICPKENASSFTFTIEDMPWFFGVLQNKYEATEKNFQYDGMELFVNKQND